MGYTRYNYRRKKKPGNNFFLLGLLIVMLISIGIGIPLAKIAFKKDDGAKKPPVTEGDKAQETNGSVEKPKDKPKKETEDEIKEEIRKEFFVLQCGVFSTEANAKKVLDEIPESYNKFIAKEDGKFKVIAGIYNEDESKKRSAELGDIQNARIKFKASENNAKIEVIIESYLKIIYKLEDSSIKSIKTDEFKKWTKKIEVKEDNKEVVDIKKHVESLPENLTKKDSVKSLEYIYELLKKVRI